MSIKSFHLCCILLVRNKFQWRGTSDVNTRGQGLWAILDFCLLQVAKEKKSMINFKPHYGISWVLLTGLFDFMAKP